MVCAFILLMTVSQIVWKEFIALLGNQFYDFMGQDISITTV